MVKRGSLLSIILFLLFGGVAQTPPETPSSPFQSALQMCEEDAATAITEDQLTGMLEETVELFQAKPDSDWITTEAAESLALPKHEPVAGFYRSIKGSTPDKNPAFTGIRRRLECHHCARVDWTENGTWHAQPYPKAAGPLQSAWEKLLKKSNVCQGITLEARQQGSYLAVIAQLGLTKGFQEVNLLRYENQKWNLVWAPTYEEFSKWEEIPLSTVEIIDGIDESKCIAFILTNLPKKIGMKSGN